MTKMIYDEDLFPDNYHHLSLFEKGEKQPMETIREGPFCVMDLFQVCAVADMRLHDLKITKHCTSKILSYL